MKKFWPDHNLAWYLAVSEVNTALASVHFKNDWLVQPSLDFWIALEIEFHENKISIESGDNGRTPKNFKIPIYVPCDKTAVKHHGGIWDPSKKGKQVKQKNLNQRCHNYSKCGKNNRVYCKCYKCLFFCSGWFAYHEAERVTNFR